MSDFDWKSIVGAVAPTLATVLGGPLAGMAVKTLSATLLGKDDGTTDEIQAALIGATPADLQKLKDADHTFKVEMGKLGVDLERIASDDRSDARRREIETKDNAPKTLATVVVIGFFATLYTIAFADIPDKAMQPVNILLGALTALLIQVGNYYFGSSAGSARKTALLGKSSGR